MSPKNKNNLIEVDLIALYQARADRAMSRQMDTVDSGAKLDELKEFSVLSAFARSRGGKH